jgi:hypothetical protein
VVFRSEDGQIHELYRQTDGKWEHKNLSAEAKGPKADGRPTAFASEDTDVQHVFYRTSEGSLIDLFRRWGSTDDKKWHSNDLTAEAKAPTAAGSPCAYLEQSGVVATSDTEHLVYRGEDGHIHELFAVPKDKWMHKDLTAEAKGPRAAGDPTAFHTQKDNIQHVFYRSSEGSLIDLYRNRKDERDKTWHSNDLTAEARAPKAVGNITAYLEQIGTVTTSTTQHLVFRGDDGQIHELYLRPKQAKWMLTNVGASIKAPQATADPVGFVEKEGPIQHVFYRTAEAGLYELYHVPEGTDRGWHGTDLSTVVKKTS